MSLSIKLILPQEVEDALTFLEEYKKIRKSLGKPIRILTKEQIFEDLTSQEFRSLIEEIKRQKPDG